MRKLIKESACGIDVSSKEHVVAVPEGRSKERVRSFGSYTQDLHRLAVWLQECKIDSVVMESTGVYWYHLYTVLVDYGFEVLLVNAYHVKNVPGRKSDVSDAQWLQELHTYGLLKGCFQPSNLTRALRDFVRLRKTIIQDMATQVHRAQKALELMNLKLGQVMRDITGTSGSRMINAILAGERSPEVLSSYADYRLKASKTDILKALEGNWREEQLFNLKLAWQHYQFLMKQLEECDQQAKKTIAQFEQSIVPDTALKEPAKMKNQPKFNLRNDLYQIFGVDVTAIDGFKSTTALTVFSETGPNLEKSFPTVKQFLSWLNVVPDNKITGGKVVYSKVKRKKNRAGQAFREAANALWNSKSALGEYLRRKKAQKGANKAIVATARKIATIYYKMVTERVEFNPSILAENNKERLKKKIEYLEKSLKLTQSQLTDIEALRVAVI